MICINTTMETILAVLQLIPTASLILNTNIFTYAPQKNEQIDKSSNLEQQTGVVFCKHYKNNVNLVITSILILILSAFL